MKAMILAAGGATKLYPLTYSLPKPLVPVLNRPVIEHILTTLASHGFDEIVINLHYLHRMIEDALGDGSRFGVKIRYSFEPELLGTAGGVRQVADFFNETFLVIGADDLTDLNLSAFLEFHRKKQALASLAATSIQNPTEVGVLEIDEEQRITWYLEKPGPERGEAGNWTNTGVYLFEPGIFQHMPTKGPYDFGSQLFPELVRLRLPFFGYREDKAFWADIGTHLGYRQAHWALLEGQSGLEMDAPEVRPHIWVDPTAQVSPQAYLRPPILIGPRCKVEANAHLQGPVVLGRGTQVKAGARIAHSVIWEGGVIGSEVSLDDCLLGSGCILKSGSRFSKVVLASGTRIMGEEERESSD